MDLEKRVMKLEEGMRRKPKPVKVHKVAQLKAARELSRGFTPERLKEFRDLTRTAPMDLSRKEATTFAIARGILADTIPQGDLSPEVDAEVERVLSEAGIDMDWLDRVLLREGPIEMSEAQERAIDRAWQLMQYKTGQELEAK
jgi:hypothetical protein